MIALCESRQELRWLGDIIIALSVTGLRISELAQLMWSDFDFGSNMIKLTDTRRQGSRNQREKGRAIKMNRDRVLPIHPDLLRVLTRMSRQEDGIVFHGPHGGKLKPDTIRNILIREVINPLAEKFPAQPGAIGFQTARLHSFRHFFCSMCASSGVPEEVALRWLGHGSSAMLRHYFHLHDDVSRKQMDRLNFVDPVEDTDFCDVNKT